MKKLVLLMALLAGLSTHSFANVGEGDTSCLKNQSTQARVTGKSKATKGETVTVTKKTSKSDQQK